jgi:RHS repeat-associated protein
MTAALVLLICAQFVGQAMAAPAVFAAHKPLVAKGHMTLQQFLAEQAHVGPSRQPFHFPKPEPVTLMKGEHFVNPQQLPPSAEPPTMKPLRIMLTSAFLTGVAQSNSPVGGVGPQHGRIPVGAASTTTPTVSPTSTPSPTGSRSKGNQPLDRTSSDHGLELQVAPGSFDLSHATTGKNNTPLGHVSTLTLTISEVHGIFAGQTDVLVAYTVAVTTAQGTPVQGITLVHPLTIIYHYNLAVIENLGLDPGTLLLSWPTLVAAARAAHQPWQPDVITLKDNVKAHTLTAQSSVITNGPLDAGANPDNASPPVPNEGGVQGNSGQFSYSYPLTVAPGPAGTVPELDLTYSSAATNDRHNHASPGGDFGEGWSLSLGAITAEEYPSNGAGGAGTWYSLSGVDHISDLLVPLPKSNPVTYQTEHISQLQIVQTTGANNEPCFDVWDTSGTEYIFGCAADALQYNTDSTGTRHNYEWDLDYVIPANEGPGTDGRYISITYEQDVTHPYNSGYTTIRDAVIKQITYGDGSTLSGTIDFHYEGPYSDGSWVTKYTSSSCNYLRCDDPINYPSGLNAPTVMATFTPTTISSYVGSDTNGNQDYSYSFAYSDDVIQECWDDYTQNPLYCAGHHRLSSVTPSVYQHGTATALPPLEVGYTPISDAQEDDYVDTSEKILDGQQDYHIATYWQYLNDYADLRTGVGASISWMRAENNTNGTPSNHGDNRYDPFYCTLYPTDCAPNTVYAWPQNHAWSVQAVTSVTMHGTDSSSSKLAPATTSYHYQLASTGSGCNGGCVGDSWIPPTDNDWMDFYHTEFRGFAEVDITSPSGDLTVQHYASTLGWGTQQSSQHNYTAGSLLDQEVYQGSQTSDPLLAEVQNIYAGFNEWNGVSTYNSCNGNYSGIYTPCEVFILSSRATQLEGNSSGPWAEDDFTYDDYSTGGGPGDDLCPGENKYVGSYHNLCTETVEGSNLPNFSQYPQAYLTKRWQYTTINETVSGWVYYDVNKVAHSEIDDTSGNINACQSFTYDQNEGSSVPSPAAGFLTTSSSYHASACTPPNYGTPAITTYAGYDLDGNQLMSVDGVGTANPTFYGSGGLKNQNGCTLSSAPAIYNTAWTAGAYTTCTAYDPASSLPTSVTNAFSQTTTTAYDATQGDLPISTTDPNSQITKLSYSYDGSGNLTIDTTEPNPQSQYTTATGEVSTCTTSSSLPCYETTSNDALYPNAVTETFYDQLGRETETRTPGPTSGQDTIQYTVYNDQLHSRFTSLPFEVTAGSGWLDPNSVSEEFGTATYYDALGRVIAVQDPLFGQSGHPGISCAPLGSNATTCNEYELDGVGGYNGDNNTYETVEHIDANNHVHETMSNVLGNAVWTRYYSGLKSGTLTANELINTQYNVLNEPTSVTTYDLTPQSGQNVTSVTETMQYDDLGRLTQLADPDRGTFTYSYDADGQVLTESNGTRTIGTNVDLLGRVGCVQVGAATSNADGSCTSGTTPLIQNTYDVTELGTQGQNDFPLGRLTRSVSSSAYPEGGTATTTELYQHDARGRIVTEQMSLSLPTSWNVTTPLPTYQLAETYTDANQPEQTTTSRLNPSANGYTFANVYDPTLGVLTGLSDDGTQNPNFATLSYNANALISQIGLTTNTGTSLANLTFSYDGDLRPVEQSATWQSGSGQSGQFFDQAVGYDDASNVTSETTTMNQTGGQSGSSSEVQNFCYDEQNRLVWAGNSGTQPAPGNGTCGNGTLSNTFPGASYSSSYLYTHLGQLWQGPLNNYSQNKQYLYCNSTAPHQVTDVVPLGQGYSCSNLPTSINYSLSYDAWGNVTGRTYSEANSGKLQTLSYNALDQMVEWQVNANNAAWDAYDASGERSLQRTMSGGIPGLTVYAFGLEEYQYDGSGNPQSSTHYYSLAGRLIAELQTQGSTSTTTCFVTDDLGSILLALSNTAGSATLLSNQLFAPYGVSRYGGGTSMSSYTSKGFTGQYGDAVTGLDYYVSRSYDPVSGLFLSADKAEGDAQGLNPYAYVGGNPETLADPTGQYISNGQQTNQNGGEEAYYYNNVFTTVTNDGYGTYWLLNGRFSSNDGSISINQFTRHQQDLYGNYNPNTDWNNSPLSKFENVTGWTQLQNSWNAPGANTNSRAEAIWKFLGTNVNNLMQLAAIFGGPEDDGVLAADDATSSLVSTLTDTATQATPRERQVAEYVASIFNGPDDSVILRDPSGLRAADGGTSDLLINGTTYDIYSPTTNNASRLLSSAAAKFTQAHGVVIDLTDTSLTASDLGNALPRMQGFIRSWGGDPESLFDVIIYDPK